MATLSKTCALTSRTKVAQKGMTIPNLSETLRLLWWHSSVYALQKNPENAKFWWSLFSEEHEFIEVMKNNYYEYFREFLKKCEIMSLSVTTVLAAGQFI